jgi:DNA polymerase I-like protein with 3'-5' exonuclease and polymerase domains
LSFEYAKEEQKKILDYCQSDVEETAKLFISQCVDIQNKNQLKTEDDFKRALFEITFRGYSQANFAQIERNGFTVDTGLVNEFNNYWPLVKNTVIERHNKELDVFEGITLRKSKFDKLVLRCGLGSRWPRLRSGNFTTNNDVVKRFEEDHPLIKKFRQLNKLLNTTKLGFYSPSEDGRVRANLNGFGSITSRCQPSNAKFPLGASKWTRNFIKPSWGNELWYLDYTAQEPAIAGYLSQDPELLSAYRTPDIYITTAQKIGMITDPNATKETHKIERGIVKDLFLAQNYGMGVKELSKRLGCSLLKARGYLNKFHRLFKVYNNKRDAWIDGSAITGHLRSPLGWQRWILGNKKWKDGKRVSIKNQLKNFIIQTTGADILRKAIQKLHDNNIKIMATLHDAVLIEIPRGETGIKNHAKSLMELASKEIVGGTIRVDEEPILTNWKQEKKHQVLFDEIFSEIKNYKKSHPTNNSTEELLEAR